MKKKLNKVFVPFGDASRSVDVKDIKIDEKRLGDLLYEFEEYKQAYLNLIETLKDKVIVDKENDLIIALDDNIYRGRIKALKIDEGENVPYMKVENGKLVKDKKKVGKIL